MSHSDFARQRVLDFIQDHYEWNCRFRPADDDDGTSEPDWNLAKAELQQLSKNHCISEETVMQGGFCLSWPPSHSPDGEKIVNIRAESPNQVLVETRFEDRDYEYVVIETSNKWSIESITSYSASDDDKVIIDPDLSAWAETEYVPEENVSFPSGLNSIFSGPLKLKIDQATVTTKIVHAGNLLVTSGFITAADPIEWDNGVAIFDLKLPAGEYPLELVVDTNSNMVGAARLVIDRDGQPAKYVIATRTHQKSPETREPDREFSNNIGVDGSYIAIADAQAIVLMNARSRVRLSNKLGDSTLKAKPNRSTETSLDDQHNILTVDSGQGDGCYPAFWELSSDNRAIALIFDFRIFSQNIVQTIRANFEAGLLSKKIFSEELTNQGMTAKFSRHDGEKVIYVSNRDVFRIVAFNHQDEQIFDSENTGYDNNDDEVFFYLPDHFPSRGSGYLNIQIFKGWQYLIEQP